jgi:Trypsin-like peptidase domain
VRRLEFVARVLSVNALCALIPVISVSAQQPASPDLQQIKGAIVVVIGKGTVPSQGNAPIASQGTGFFVSKDGLLVTSDHLRTDLAAADPDTISYEVHFGATSPDVVKAIPVYIQPVADIMVLHAPVEDRDVPILIPGTRKEIPTGIASVYTAGYPQGYLYSVDEGIIKSYGTTDPIPVWSTSLNFKSGQSGSPVVLANLHVIAIVKGNDATAASLGLVVPSRYVPPEYWDGPSTPSLAIKQALAAGNLDTVTHVSIAGLVSSTDPVTRQIVVDLVNDSCAGTRTKTFRVDASPGYAIDQGTIKIEPLKIIGEASKYVTTDRSSQGFTLAVELSNLGHCVNVPGRSVVPPAAPDTVESGVTAEFQGRVSYTERPQNPTPQTATFVNAAVIGNGQTPLPNVPVSDLLFSLSTGKGGSKSFTPQASELITRGGLTYLDAKKVEARVLSSNIGS